MSDYERPEDVYIIKDSWTDEWKDVPGKWSLTHHARTRLQLRYDLTDGQIDELLESLDREILVRVPNRKERENTYTVQAMVDVRGIFLVAGCGTKTIITVLTPFFRFPGELTSNRLEVAHTDYLWTGDFDPSRRQSIERVVDINEGDDFASPFVPASELSETALHKRALSIANARIKELERQLCAIRSIVGVALGEDGHGDLGEDGE